MRVTVDGEPRDWEYLDDTSLQDVLIDVNKRLLTEEQKIVSEIKLDETVPGLDMSLTPDQVTAGEIVAMSFQTLSFVEAVLGNLEASEQKLTEVRDAISGIVGHIISDEIDLAMNKLKECIDILIWFFDSLQQASAGKLINLDEIQITDMKLPEYITKLNDILNELVTAMKNNDFTLINDYLEYEVEPAIEDLIAVVPQLISSVKGD